MHYAWGLVCLRHGRCQEGAEQFRLATRSDDAFYPPAWQTLARGQVANQEYVPALQTLIQLAERLEKAESGQLDAQAARRCAQWMGRMIGCLQRLLDPTSVLPRPVTAYEARITVRLSDRLVNAYEEGKRESQRKPPIAGKRDSQKDAQQSRGPLAPRRRPLTRENARLAGRRTN